MAKIVIECSDLDDAATACRMVADELDKGEKFGTLGWSTDDWWVDPD